MIEIDEAMVEAGVDALRRKRYRLKQSKASPMDDDEKLVRAVLEAALPIMAVAGERERCAEIADDFPTEGLERPDSAARLIADAIRTSQEGESK